MIVETAEYNKHENYMIRKSTRILPDFFSQLLHGKQFFVIILTFATFYGSDKGKWLCSNVQV